jgi:hypothetical protein
MAETSAVGFELRSPVDASALAVNSAPVQVSTTSRLNGWRHSPDPDSPAPLRCISTGHVGWSGFTMSSTVSITPWVGQRH